MGKQHFSAGAVIYYKNYQKKQLEYLVLKYEVGHWDLPKGHIDKGESYFETIKREVEEETGIKKVTINKEFKEQIRYFFRDYEKNEKGEHPWVFKMVTFFPARAYTKKVKISPEHTDYAWLPYKEALKKITYKKAKKVLRKANKYLVKEGIAYK